MISLTIRDRATPYLKRIRQSEIRRIVKNLLTTASFVLDKFQKATAPDPNFSLKQLKAMGHPYGIRPTLRPRAPIPHVPPWLINQQTGQLNRDLTVFPLHRTGDEFWVQIGVKRGSKTEKYGPLVIFGTSKMVGRNFMVESVMANLETIRGLMLRSRVRRGPAWRGIKGD